MYALRRRQEKPFWAAQNIRDLDYFITKNKLSWKMLKRCGFQYAVNMAVGNREDNYRSNLSKSIPEDDVINNVLKFLQCDFKNPNEHFGSQNSPQPVNGSLNQSDNHKYLCNIRTH